MPNSLVIKPVEHNVFDIFFGAKGWDTFIRVRKQWDRKTRRVYFSVVNTEEGAHSVSREVWESIKGVI